MVTPWLRIGRIVLPSGRPGGLTRPAFGVEKVHKHLHPAVPRAAPAAPERRRGWPTRWICRRPPFPMQSRECGQCQGPSEALSGRLGAVVSSRAVGPFPCGRSAQSTRFRCHQARPRQLRPALSRFRRQRPGAGLISITKRTVPPSTFNARMTPDDTMSPPGASRLFRISSTSSLLVLTR